MAKKFAPKIFDSTLHTSGYFRHLLEQPILSGVIQLEKLALYQQTTGPVQMALKEELYHSNWRLIYSLAKHYVGRIGFDTLYQEGCIGFFVSLDKINLKSKILLSTVATAWIRQKIIRAINREGFLIGLPEHVYSEISKPLKKARKGKRIQNLKIADIIMDGDLDKEKLNKFFTYFQCNVSMSDYLDSNNEGNNIDTKALKDLEYLTQTKDIHQAVNSIKNPRNRHIIIRYYGLDGQMSNTLAELGRIHGITRERIRQIIQHVFRVELRDKLRAYDLGSH